MQSLDAHQVSKNLGGDEGLNLSLRDIQLVLATSKYPEDKAFKLHERSARKNDREHVRGGAREFMSEFLSMIPLDGASTNPLKLRSLIALC